MPLDFEYKTSSDLPILVEIDGIVNPKQGTQHIDVSITNPNNGPNANDVV